MDKEKIDMLTQFQIAFDAAVELLDVFDGVLGESCDDAHLTLASAGVMILFKKLVNDLQEILTGVA